ncbi:uncharacterized protein LOC126842576 [Adelges cooleyi]|uniref:uncharacterized protein LOC126842576 n=1 Tax=Adelges cooleyi TaxID=133065 RepID=UPI00217F3BF8|nr:uncharacterized protein LOC126842576 [Adelges cooleyi]
MTATTAFEGGDQVTRDLQKLCLKGGAVEFVTGYENPVSWHRKHHVPREQLSKDVLFDNLDMKSMTLAQYYGRIPEYIKWKLFNYNLVICYEYIRSKTKLSEALNILKDIKHILTSINDKDKFLQSVKIALGHIAYSLKGYVLSLCNDNKTELENFESVNDMDNVNKAALFGVQSVFFYEYGLPYVQISSDCALKAISLNESEAEWHYLMARVLTNYYRQRANQVFCSKREIEESEIAVHLGKKPHHKLHLVLVYQRMCRTVHVNPEARKAISKETFKLLKEVMNETNDLFLLKNCLLSLCKLPAKEQNNMTDILEKLVDKLESSNNGYIHGAIGHYYLFIKKDYDKAKSHLKLAMDVKSFGSSIDYVYALFKIDPETAPVEKMMSKFLDIFSHPIQQEKLLSQIISYLIITKDDIVKSLPYISMLFIYKDAMCLQSLKTHVPKFSLMPQKYNLLDVIKESLLKARLDESLSADDVDNVNIVLTKLDKYVLSFKPEIFFNCKNNKGNFNEKNLFQFNNKNVREKKSDEDNWRKLKPEETSSSSFPQIVHNKNRQQRSNRDNIIIIIILRESLIICIRNNSFIVIV